MSFAFIFPGQGSQYIGMGQALADAFPSAKAVFDEVDSALDQKLSTLMWAGTADELTLTANTQPALMACSLAAMKALETEFGVKVTDAAFVAGHSLGEYSALAAAQSISTSDTAKLLRIRGEAMQSSVPVGAGAMAALLGASVEDAEAACVEGSKLGIVQIANDNATGQIVISGEKAAVEAAAQAARDAGVKKAMMLNVSAPFHCDMMKHAADAMDTALGNYTVLPPLVPVVNNIQARPVTDPDDLRQDLVKQVTGRVRWRESVEWMASEGNIDTFAEPGCGKVLTVMLRRIVKGLNGHQLDTPEALEAFAKLIKG
ncbi:malonyl CoA-acyl carrier protein transacylase [Litorimonas cladophorae]|uniref:Malonyl CoA-acyl carrier protein transacylase n=1 Tax=Litorimonas cladophorae TaxID=1220491 RepID=A0A918KFM0_9PROT|nr:ACP S-malonyltransferase [Litorimonas cladophorae]GGX61698.1 malonyl CoA-acyl carrier protein transacylase [Litorimonas cladophorae]